MISDPTPVSLLIVEESLRLGGLQVAGVDEAGRGPLAGPVVAAAVIFQAGTYIDGVDDSKKLTPRVRAGLFDQIMSRALAVGVGTVDNMVIDEINILNATFLAMDRAVGSLGVRPGHLIIDGNLFRPGPATSGIPFSTIIGGDGECFSIAAASIVAKVTRDRLMEDFDSVYPGYGFAGHKGYGTADHREAILRLGICPIHRRSFRASLLADTVTGFETRSPHRRNLRREGTKGEDIAARFLVEQGYRIVERNFRFKRKGEIDIIARDGAYLVFCEVKMRTNDEYGLPEYSVTPMKQETIRSIAAAYLAIKGIDDQPCRFDVVTILCGGNTPLITLLRNAF
jgi:ribonuclease HII